MKVLHISTWYPTYKSPKTALWVSRHVEALNQAGIENKLYHVEARIGDWELSFGKKELLGNLKYKISLMRAPWFLLELLSFFLVSWVIFKERKNQYQVINFHIAYPNLTYWYLIKRLVKTPVVITEHWSAYHFNFGVKKELPRVKRIFCQQIPVVAVSQSLVKDIEVFSGGTFDGYVVPNIVNQEVFFPNEKKHPEQRFFMVSAWSEPKRPLMVIRAFKKLIQDFPDARLVIAGYGRLWDQMKSEADGVNQIELIGSLDSTEIAEEMNKATAYLHPSDYETFSVVCAEALYCACPVIASAVGGIVEMVNADNGILVKENTEDEFLKAMKYTLENDLSVRSIPEFSNEAVGQMYVEVLKQVSGAVDQ